jgi:carbonic anhydrase
MRLLLSLALASAIAFASSHPDGLNPEKALAKLMEGNKRHVQHRETHPDATVKRRLMLAKVGQNPFAVILGCADSRVPPELVFDQGLGDLFVVRDAGNVIDDEMLGSIEYAVEHLGVHLVMVLGHEKCGAVSAAVAGGEAPGHIKAVLHAIEPSVEATRTMPGDRIHNCVVANAVRTAKEIRESEPILKEKVKEGLLKVVAADYDLASGKVVILQ